MADDLKNKGNNALNMGRIDEAIEYYSKAIEIDSKNHVLHSNRSAAFCKLGNYEKALEDAQKCVDLQPNWSKGYSRKAAALEFLKKYEDAAEVYEMGLKVDPANEQLKKGLSELQSRSMNSGDKEFSFHSLFSDPGFLEKLNKNPKTRDYMNDPTFKMKLELIKNDPSMLNMLMQDKQIMEVIAVGLGVDSENIEIRQDKKEESPKPTPKTEKKTEKMEVDMTDQEQAAVEAKDKGNEAYKAKKFDEAIQFYDEAIALDKSNCTFYTNKAAVYYEKGEHEKCIEICNEAIDIGRNNRADYKLVAKAYARAGNSYLKLDDLDNAKKYFEKSLSESRVPEVVKKLQEVELRIRDKEKLAYINPEIAEQEKQLGNTKFQKGKYPEAMKHYNEAIKRNPNDPKLYSNRAACYTKLMEFPMALKDCDKCIELDPKFIKAYLRKANCHISMKDTSRAQTAFRKALEIDPNCDEAKDGLRNIAMMPEDPEELRKKAMNDPEIQQILSDPAMQVILNQMQKDPAAFKEHLQDPHIAANLQKLMDKGFIAIR